RCDSPSAALLRRSNPQIAEGAFLAVDPQPDLSARAACQAADDQAWRFGVVDPHDDLLLRHLDAGVEPDARVGEGLDRRLVDARVAFAQLLPGVLGPGDVLDRVGAIRIAVAHEVERTEVDRFEGAPVGDAEGDAEEARLLRAVALQI